jgi:hypothetical protein
LWGLKESTFFCVVKGRFYRGSGGKVRFYRGVFVVKLWRCAGESWCVDGYSCGAEKHATFFKYFFRPVSFSGRLGFWFVADGARLRG